MASKSSPPAGVAIAEGQDLPIPGRLNWVILVAASGVCSGALWVASHAPQIWQMVLAALIFSYANNTLFALLHEAVHGVFHPNKALNQWGGRWAAAFFPTGYLVQRAFHLTHHKNNRSRLEQFDYIHPGDIRWLKVAQWYAILTGLYWPITVFGVVAFALVPRVLRVRLLRGRESVVAEQTSSGPYLDALDDLPPVAARLELVGSAALQALLWWALDLDLVGWLLCYAAFGLNWSSLQYADHAFSPLDVRNGAWNLQVHPWIRKIFLNYHYHLAHHQHPNAPWIHLGRWVDPQVAQPRFWKIWLAMWRGPRPYPGDPPENTP